MKCLVFAVACLALGASVSADSCYLDVSLDCSQASNSLALPRCNAVYGEYGRHGNVASEMQAYANLHLAYSFDYLLSAAYFSNYQTNRAGFAKFFRKLSDDKWEKTIGLIKHITLRGDQMNFAQRSTQKPTERKNYTAELHEMEAMGSALDKEKEIADKCFYIHREATRNSQHLHDPEIAQYLEEEFIEYHAKTIREMAGYTNDMKNFVSNGYDMSMSMYVFDEHLQKVV